MQAFATALGKSLRCGDILLLEGHIGAGKSFFARSLIQSVQDIPEEVPSQRSRWCKPMTRKSARFGTQICIA